MCMRKVDLGVICSDLNIQVQQQMSAHIHINIYVPFQRNHNLTRLAKFPSPVMQT